MLEYQAKNGPYLCFSGLPLGERSEGTRKALSLLPWLSTHNKSPVGKKGNLAAGEMRTSPSCHVAVNPSGSPRLNDKKPEGFHLRAFVFSHHRLAPAHVLLAPKSVATKRWVWLGIQALKSVAGCRYPLYDVGLTQHGPVSLQQLARGRKQQDVRGGSPVAGLELVTGRGTDSGNQEERGIAYLASRGIHLLGLGVARGKVGVVHEHHRRLAGANLFVRGLEPFRDHVEDHDDHQNQGGDDADLEPRATAR